MRGIVSGVVIATTGILLGACAEQAVKKAESDLSKLLSPGCYTVDLFDPYEIEHPGPDVPVEMHGFLGVWKNGAWNGAWCHDLYVTKVYADGSVDVLDAYGPFAAARREATVFKRKGRIKDGVMTLNHGRAAVNYRLVDAYLVGKRRDSFGTYEITMSREQGLPATPAPLPRPVKLAES